MKDYSLKEKEKAEELLMLCNHIQVEEISGKCVPIRMLNQKFGAVLISSQMMNEYNYGICPKGSYEYERFLFWKNVHEILENIRF